MILNFINKYYRQMWRKVAINLIRKIVIMYEWQYAGIYRWTLSNNIKNHLYNTNEAAKYGAGNL
jgi:hypothetical protein